MKKRFESPSPHYKFHVCGLVHENLWKPMNVRVCQVTLTFILSYTYIQSTCMCVCVYVSESGSVFVLQRVPVLPFFV